MHDLNWLYKTYDLIVGEVPNGITSSTAVQTYLDYRCMLADLVLGVVKGAEKLMGDSRLKYGMTQDECDLTDALAALKEAITASRTEPGAT